MDEALEYYEKSLNYAANDDLKSSAFHNIGNVYFDKKDFQKSIDAYKRSLKYNPDNPDTRKNLLMAKEMLQQQKNQQQNQQQNQKQDQNQNQEKIKTSTRSRIRKILMIKTKIKIRMTKILHRKMTNRIIKNPIKIMKITRKEINL
ncbi:MAG: tetratricopeptide repeat protein [Saprospiraceae bacterium]